MTRQCLFQYFNTSLEMIRPAVMLYVRFLRSLRNVEDLLHERGVEAAMRLCGSGGSAPAGIVEVWS
jgi:putative transposase